MSRDAAPAWLWLPELGGADHEFLLEADDAHYVARVCRAQPGDRLTATDGAGAVADLEVLAVRGEVRVRVAARRDEPRGARAIVACGAPEKDRADWLVEKLAELGVAEFQPLDAERDTWERFASRRDRLERLAAAGLRQSCRPWKLVLRDPVPVRDWVAGLVRGGRRWLADPEGPADPSPPAVAVLDLAAIGPAPGFSAAERSTFIDAGFQPISLGDARLRTETAALVWAGIWSAGAGRTKA